MSTFVSAPLLPADFKPPSVITKPPLYSPEELKERRAKGIKRAAQEQRKRQLAEVYRDRERQRHGTDY
jgi:hypothetical protein